MKERRYIQTFRYRDCDAFAGFLHERSLQGWHFKGFKAGLVFEQGDPADIYYTAEVFPKGTEMDTRPEAETEEYAEYCKAAGWELIDSSRKFCVFRRVRENAVPIVEPRERFLNIQKAECLLWLSGALPVFLIACFQCVQMLTWNFTTWFCNDLMFFVLFFMAAACMERLTEGAALLFWSFTRKRMLRAGIIPVYGRKRRLIARPFLAVILFVPAFFLAFHLDPGIVPYLLPAAVTLILLLLVTGGIAVFRPARADNYIFQIAAGVLIFFCCTVVMTAFILSGSDTEYTSEHAEAFPLVQSDYRQISGRITGANADHMKGILGERSYFLVEYTLDNGTADSLRYIVYHSSCPWVLDRLWEDVRPKPEEHPADRTKVWNAVSALSSMSGRGVCKEAVRYADRLLVLTTDARLDDRQIARIQEAFACADTHTDDGFSLHLKTDVYAELR